MLVHHTHINFLDLTIFKGDLFQSCGILSTKIYQKPINRYCYLHPNSYHPRTIFKGFIYGELRRYLLYSSSYADFLQVKALFFARLLNRGYSLTYLCQMFNEWKEPRRQHLLQLTKSRPSYQPWYFGQNLVKFW